MRPKYSGKLNVIVGTFCSEFEDAFKTTLVGGGEEPLYVPLGKSNCYANIIFKEDYLASALHEIAHWCIAGSDRRAQIDYGYWYNPDGRTAQQQDAFLAAEIKPQTLEWMFSVACQENFNISVDNLMGDQKSDYTSVFAAALVEQATLWCSSRSIPSRGLQFLRALQCQFGIDASLLGHYDISQLSRVI
ncbi:MAG: elongation factor P hydroxylase [Porticoccaceae bacterium]|nr:elongation factor P hydroxylase [Porticoccaceae bacterium]MDG1474165.1 elongation factor P hydroxylase [Porticoccaceae bacterium]